MEQSEEKKQFVKKAIKELSKIKEPLLKTIGNKLKTDRDLKRCSYCGIYYNHYGTKYHNNNSRLCTVCIKREEDKKLSKN